MREILACFLIAAMLVANFEVVLDLDEVWPDDGDTAGLLVSLDDHGHNDTDQGADCDHCCHGSAHLAGVISDQVFSIDYVPSQTFRRIFADYRSIVAPRHLRPPIA